MNKNLKKVISSLVALTLSLSSVAAFAASFSDVPETESYASAVSELVALKVVNGDDDGTFKPENKVKRSEATKMVVAALNQTQAAESSKGATKFTDVAADHWASGFINIGTGASGFINGMGDGTFNPDGSVTYEQLVKMLVTTCGFGQVALANGGYPTGFMSIASQYGMTKGMSGVNGSDELTKAQVAVLIDNAMKMPMLETTSWSAYNPEYEVKNGEGDDYVTMLTKYHNAYVVGGRVTATNKTTAGSLDADKVRFRVESADNFDGDYINRKDIDVSITDEGGEEVFLGDTDADKYLQIYANAIIQKNDDDDYVMLSIVPSGKSTETVREIGAFDYENKEYNKDAAGALVNGISSGNKVMYLYDTAAKKGSSKSYKLDDDWQLYVNGVNVGATKENVQDYIVDNTAGDITLLDVPTGTNSSTDGKYDCVFVTYYKTATVSSVAGSKNKLTFNQMMTDMKAIELDDEEVADGNLTYHITMDGQALKATDLQEDDIVAIAYDVSKKMDESTFYEIIVTRGTVEGQVTTFDDELGFLLGDTYYKSTDWKTTNVVENLEVGTTYELWVDAFGRYIDYDEAATTKKIAILDNVYTSTDGETKYVKVVLPDNTQATYELKNDSDAPYIASIIGMGTTKTNADGTTEAYKKTDYDANANNNWVGNKFDGTKAPIQNRVVEYRLNASNEFSVDVEDICVPVPMVGDYRESTTKINGKTLNSDAKIIDAADYNDANPDLSDLDSMAVASFMDDTYYEAYGFDQVSSDKSYRFIIVRVGTSSYTDDTRLAVFNKELVKTDANGDSVKAIEVYLDGELTTFEVSDDVCPSNQKLTNALSTIHGKTIDLTIGDVLLLKKDGNDQLTTIDVVYDNDAAAGYDTYFETAMTALKGGNTAVMKMFDIPKEWDKTQTANTEVEVAFGPIVDKDSKNVTLATLDANGKSVSANDKDYSFASDVKVYVFDTTQTGLNRLDVGSLGDVVKSTGWNSKNDEIDWTSADVNANFAFVKMVDRDVTDIFVVLNDK